MKHTLFNMNFVISLILMTVLLIGCSGDRANNSGAGVIPVTAVPSVRTVHDQMMLMEEATGIPRSTSSVQALLSDRGPQLSSTGGVNMSGAMLQASMDLAATYCVAAVNNAASGLPQKVFPSYVKFAGAPSAKLFPDTVVVPLAAHLLEQFSGNKPTDAEMKIAVAAINGFIEQQRIDNNNGNGTKRAMEAACVLAAVSLNSVLTR